MYTKDTYKAINKAIAIKKGGYDMASDNISDIINNNTADDGLYDVSMCIIEAFNFGFTQGMNYQKSHRVTKKPVLDAGAKLDYYTVRQAAELLQVHENTIYKRIRNGSLKAYKIGKENRIEAAELKKLIAN